jgi:hypothetical protein
MSRTAVNSGLVKALISRLNKLSLQPGDQLVLEFPAKVYTSPTMLSDAQRFAQSVADLTKHEVVIVAEGVDIYARRPTPTSGIMGSLSSGIL